MRSKSLSAGSIDAQSLQTWVQWLQKHVGPIFERFAEAIFRWGSALHLDGLFEFLTKHLSLDQWMHSWFLPLLAGVTFVVAVLRRERVIAGFVFVSAAMTYIFYFLLPDMKVLQLSSTALFSGAILTAAIVGIYYILIRSD